MPVYLVERELPGVTMARLARLQDAETRSAAQSAARAEKVRYVRSIFVPEDSRCFCLFEADDAALVRALNEQAQLPFTRIVEALDLTL
jgi:hypothetical protein